MFASIRFFHAALAAACALGSICAAPLEVLSAPDSVFLRDGAVVHGLIIRNSGGKVTIQTKSGEETYTRDEITRIDDVPGEGAYLTDIERKGSLPPWRTMVNDLRHNDSVKSLEQIPATVIGTGEFKNVPYLSFRVNGIVELNIYGDPEDPAGVELGIYGSKQGSKKLRRICREFLVSYLNTRDEIEAVYQLDPNGGSRDVGDMTVEYTPASAEDADGAWWISVYNRKLLADERLSDAEYEKLTLPVGEVLDHKGQVRATAWTNADTSHSLRLHHGDGDHVFVRGFYRDKNGTFRVITVE